MGVVAVSGYATGGYSLLDPRQILGGQADVECPEGLAQAVATPRTGQGDDVVARASTQAMASSAAVAPFSVAIAVRASTRPRFFSRFSPWNRGR